MKRIKSYFTVRAESTTKLDEMVNAEISKGSQPYGSPYVFQERSESDLAPEICQVVVQHPTPFHHNIEG